MGVLLYSRPIVPEGEAKRNGRKEGYTAKSNERGIAAANEQARAQGLEERARFQVVDAGQRLPFEEGTFDAAICIDAINHLPNRPQVLAEWYRVLKPDGRLLFTDPITMTGLISAEEVAIRSSIGYFLFAPPGEDERMIQETGFELIMREDVTGNTASVAQRWHDARASYRDELIKLEGEATFEGTQRFLSMAHRLASGRRLSRFVFLARKP
jgi:SAM-dependent methyltransferase